MGQEGKSSASLGCVQKRDGGSCFSSPGYMSVYGELGLERDLNDRLSPTPLAFVQQDKAGDIPAAHELEQGTRSILCWAWNGSDSSPA